jgi:GT2 family glycosyltransferase
LSHRDPLIGVVVPVWQGAAFVAETLANVLAQRSVALRLLVSIDGGDDASAEACRPFLKDSRVSLMVQSQRLGWVGNAATLVEAALAADVDYVCIQPHDDLIVEDYLAALLAAAVAAPSAAVVYSDIEAFGAMTGILFQASVLGSPLARMASLLLDHFNAVAFRGLMRADAIRRVGTIAGNDVDDFAADTVWMTRLATVGELVRVPEPLYRKRFHQGNTHGAWGRWPLERRAQAWSRHCLDMLREALSVTEDRNARQMLAKAALVRYHHGAGPSKSYASDISRLPEQSRRLAAGRFRRGVKALLELEEEAL